MELTIPFSAENIDRSNYTLSLIEKMLEADMLSVDRQLELKRTFDEVFRETAEQYTQRASGSLSRSRAEPLYSSVLYRCDVYLLSLNSDSLAADKLKRCSPALMLARGTEKILSLCEEVYILGERVRATALDLPLYEYRHAALKACDEFKKGYSARFDAKNICTSIDYPLYKTHAYALESSGVLFMHEYLTRLYTENIYCTQLSQGEIIRILEKFGQKYGCRYTRLLFNIVEALLEVEEDLPPFEA